MLDQTLLRNLALAALAALGLYLLSYWLGRFDNLQLATIAYYFVAIAGLTVLTGLNGQISLGHGALMAIGAYATIKVGESAELPLAALLAIATIATALVGVVIGAGAARLRGPYLAGATLALAVGLPALANRFPDFLGGENGLSTAPPVPPSSLGVGFALERWQAWIACAAALITFVVLANLVRSRYGRAFRAVRDDEVAAALAGLNVARVQVLAFVVSAACAGLAGGLLVVVTSLAAPGAFTLELSIALLTAAVLGGLGSLAGAVWGAAIVVLLPTWAEDIGRELSLSTSVEANLPLLVYGVVLIGVMLAAPRGIQGALSWAGGLIGRRVRGHTEPRSRGASAPGEEIT
ncbi:MAG: branched-chain amino acid ABC transporter permease [Solirubrobacterales bacterium]|nr:branched-chain amino acid ABC transporter permease [Solirubrobacterales bacterium]